MNLKPHPSAFRLASSLIYTIALVGLLGFAQTLRAEHLDVSNVEGAAKEQLAKKVLRGRRRIAFEVVELGTKFAFDDKPLDEAGLPTYGNAFITQGVIYPAGTVTRFEDGSTDGVIVETDEEGNVTARPEFPERVVGVWICRGTVFGDDGFNITSGPVVNTTQLYDFKGISGGFGEISIVSEGLELIDVGQALKRSVTGGTGSYERIRGEIEQTLIGFNSSEGFTLGFALKGRR